MCTSHTKQRRHGSMTLNYNSTAQHKCCCTTAALLCRTWLLHTTTAPEGAAGTRRDSLHTVSTPCSTILLAAHKPLERAPNPSLPTRQNQRHHTLPSARTFHAAGYTLCRNMAVHLTAQAHDHACCTVARGTNHPDQPTRLMITIILQLLIQFITQ